MAWKPLGMPSWGLAADCGLGTFDVGKADLGEGIAVVPSYS